MDDAVLRSLAKWPDVPAVYGWLELDRRGHWRIKGERIANQALRDFISRNYESDSAGRWFFQNGPQRVFVRLAYAPLVLRYEGERLVDHCGRDFGVPDAFLLDEEGSVLARRDTRIALLDDRDLGRFAERAHELEPVRRAELPVRFGFVPDPALAQS